MNKIPSVLALAAGLFTSGCTVISPPLVGGTAGAAVGAAVGHGNPLVSAAGAAVGAGAGAWASNSVKAAYQRGLDDGYLQGSSDAVKRLYWEKQHLEAPQSSASSAEALLAPERGPSGGEAR